MPQTASDPYWKAQLKGFTTGQVKRLTNSLGNLVATSGPRNSSLRNRAFPDKARAIDKQTSYRFGSYSEIEVSQYSDWGPNEILKRGLSLLKFMAERWEFSLPSEKICKKALGLEFLP